MIQKVGGSVLSSCWSHVEVSLGRTLTPRRSNIMYVQLKTEMFVLIFSAPPHYYFIKYWSDFILAFWFLESIHSLNIKNCSTSLNWWPVSVYSVNTVHISVYTVLWQGG